MNNTKIQLDLNEKLNLFNNRLNAFVGLRNIMDKSFYSSFSIDSRDYNNPHQRHAMGINDRRPVEEIVADIELLWKEIREEVLASLGEE